MVTFNQIPTTQRVPWVYVEFDASRAQSGPALKVFKGLLVGQMLTGAATAGVLVRITSEDDAAAKFGAGSMLHAMAQAWYAQQRTTALWVYPIADEGPWVAAVATQTVAGTATAAGKVALHAAGRRYEVPVAVGSTATAIRDALVAKVNADPNRLVQAATAAGATFTLTARNKGEQMNGAKVIHSYFDGETLPAGITLTLVDLAGGTGVPSLTPLVTALGDEQFDCIASAYTDVTSVATLDADLVARWGPLDQADGMAFITSPLAYATLASFGNTLNSPHLCLSASFGSPTPAFMWTAAVAAVAAVEAQQDPARPFQTLPLVSILAPRPADRWTMSERNLALFDGISTTVVDPSGVVRLERTITTYQRNASSQEDTAYLDVQTVFTLAYLRYSFRVRMLSKYPRHKLAKNGVGLPPGLDVVTPLSAKAEAIAWFVEMQQLGLVENLDAFKEQLVVEVSASDPNRLEFLLPPDLVNQLRVVAAQIQFRL
jgi:phage tail sheath gpL-like